MSDLPLDETALQAAAKASWDQPHASGKPRRLRWDQLMPSQRDRLSQEIGVAISTYLRVAQFEIQKEYYSTPTPRPTGMQRQIGPWEKTPVVQAESEEE